MIGSAITVRRMLPGDAPAVLAIYQAGLDTDLASFETDAPSWPSFDRSRLPGHRLVAVGSVGDGTAGDGSPGGGSPGGGSRDHVVGWVAVSAVSDRAVYAGVVEHSIYVHPTEHGRGVGRVLLQALIESTEAGGIWTIQSGVFPENTASLALHARLGFRVVGVRERIGRHRGRWRDVVFLERRSRIVD